MEYISFIEALALIMQMAKTVFQKTFDLTEQILQTQLDIIMSKAIVYFGLNNSLDAVSTG